MNNKEFLNTYKSLYDSLKYFYIENNTLKLNYDYTYSLPLDNINLANLNSNVYLLNPKEIYSILYAISLLPKNSLTNEEVNFITQYAKRYLRLNDLALEENENVDKNLVWCLSIPIYTSYDPNFIELPTSKIIQDMFNNHSNDLENGKGKQMRLVLKNPNVEITENEDNTNYFEKAGFTTIILVVAAIVISTLYITLFILNN